MRLVFTNHTMDDFGHKRLLDDESSSDEEPQAVPEPQVKRPNNKLQSEIAKLRKELEEKGSIYVTKLPANATVEDVTTAFEKYGPIQHDKTLGKPRVTMFSERDESDAKTKCIVYYQQAASATRALTSETNVAGLKVSVQPATFGSLEAGSIPRPKALTKEQRDAMATKAMQLRAKEVKVANMYRVLEMDPQLRDDITADVKDECAKLGAEDVAGVRFDSGDVYIEFSRLDLVDKCIRGFDGRWFDGLKITAMRVNPK